MTCREFDNADREVTLIENCQCEGSSSSSSPAADVNRTTHYEYTDDSLLSKLKCENSSTGEQVTEWEYGVSQLTGSELASNRLGRRLTDTATVNDAALDATIAVLEAVWEVRGLRSRAAWTRNCQSDAIKPL